MFGVYCPVCDRRMLLGVDEVDWVENLAPGMISVSGHCPRGHDVAVLTGERFTPHKDPRHYGPAPRIWTRPMRRLGDLFSALAGKFPRGRDLPETYYRY
ncbi:MAG: hypothetical protein JWQ81_5355 [Amycolatopsis sp.]|uniref:hypothetical protein n=1 Tax=Amycolatopsis sp. TaxID=37632 RepID=UPI00262C713A|nr:hypothetical protein [Amycolatopsis sp.]MCU1684616.1 hypothetical protein [Amycolatopsis sp.]